MKKLLFGIDFGTGGCKATLIDDMGNICATAYQEYPSEHKLPKWSEQNPQLWIEAFLVVIKKCKEKIGNNFSALEGISISASTHNAVLLDKNNNVIRNCIMWNDQRSDKQSAVLKELHGEMIFNIAMAMPSPTWTLPQLMWVKENEPENYSKICRIMFVKDYIRNFLTKDYYTDIVDAQSSLFFDAKKMMWSKEICSLIELPIELLPPVLPSKKIAGYVGAESAKITGLPEGVPVITGCSDTAAEDFGAGAIHNGQMIIKMATAGNVNIISDTSKPHPMTYTYPYSVEGMWYTVSGTNTCAASYRWLRDSLYITDKKFCDSNGSDVYELMNSEAMQSQIGAKGLIFHPYLLGERCPYFNSNARANFFGISMFHTRGDFARALLEGVGYSLYDCFLILKDFNKNIEDIRIIGRASKSPLWSQIISDIFGLEIQSPKNAESSYGGALLAGVGVGIFENEYVAVDKCVEIESVYKPNTENHKRYMKYFDIYRDIVKSTNPIWDKLNTMLEN